MVLRRYVWPGFLEDEPIAPQRELDALRFAVAHDAAAPNAIAADIIGEDIGDGIPAILMTFLPGRAMASPDPSRLAEAAAEIHAIDADDFPHRYFPWFDGIFERPPSNAERPELWERALEVRAGGAPKYRPVFIHRDFHPGNVLWRRGRTTGVVDWANACRGPAGSDVATCRRNLLDWADADTADKFVAAYEVLTGEEVHPYWEIASVLEHGPSPWTAEHIGRSEMQLERALATLGR